MFVGRIKWFNDAKGFGFIEPQGGVQDLLADFSAIETEVFRTLKQGGTVSYELVQGPKSHLTHSARLMASQYFPQNPAQAALAIGLPPGRAGRYIRPAPFFMAEGVRLR